MHLIGCDTCHRTFAELDGHSMLDAITGTCPGCGGTFVIVAEAPQLADGTSSADPRPGTHPGRAINGLDLI